MSKKTSFVFLLMFLTLFGVLSAQYTTVDFESVGAGWNWSVSENGTNPALTFPANPNPSGVNTSTTAARFVAQDAGASWALCYTDDIEPFEFNANNCTVSIQVYKPITSDVGIKFEGGSAAMQLVVPNTVVNQWQTLTFNFSAAIGNTYSRIVIIPDFADRAQDNTLYFDNIVIPEGNIQVVEPDAPSVAAPVPNVAAANVISVFSDSYTNMAGTGFNPNWGQTTTVSTMDISGNHMLRYTNFNYQGTQFNGAQDLSSMNYIHVDMWTTDATMVLFGPISITTGGYLVSLTPINSGSWNSYDIPLSSFTGVSLTDIHQLKFDCTPGHTPSTIYLDNIYFYHRDVVSNDASLSDLKVSGTTITGFSPTTYSYSYRVAQGVTTVPTVTATATNTGATVQVNPAAQIPGTTNVVVTAADQVTTHTYSVVFSYQSTTPTTAAPTPTVNAANVISVFSDSYTNITGTNFSPNWGQNTAVSTVSIAGNNTLQYSNCNFQGTQFASAQDLSAMTYVHLDMYTTDATMVLFGPISVSTGGYLVSLTPINSGSWNSYDIPLSSFPTVNLTDVHQLKLDCTPGAWPANIFVDNIYFYNRASSTDATLSDLKVNGTTISGFSPSTLTYTYRVIQGTTVVPTVTATASDTGASVQINATALLPGTTEVVVTAADHTTTQTYRVNFVFMAAAPTAAATAPTHAAADVVSIFSDSYTNLTDTNFNPNWGQSTTVTTEALSGNNMLKYANFNYQGTQLSSNRDFSLMEYLHIDMWTSSATVVKFSPISATTGEHLVTLTPLDQGVWNSYDIPLSSFTGVSMTNIHQLKFDGQNGVSPSTIYLDNIYFWKNPTVAGSDATLSDLRVNGTTVTGFTPATSNYTVVLPYGSTVVPTVTGTTNDANATLLVTPATALPGTTTARVTAQNGTTTITYNVNFTLADPVPTVAAPTPSHSAADVISLFSNAYTNVTVDTWSASWDQADETDMQVAGNDVKRYTNMSYAGIEFTSSPINANNMGYFHMDVWTPNSTTAPAVFKIKLVDFGANGVWSGGDDVEHEITLDENTMDTATWVSLDIPLSAFTNLTTRQHLAQLIISGLSTVYIDNVYFYAAAPVAPQNVRVALSGSNVTVSWNAVSGATSYKVYTATSPEGPFTLAGTVSGATSWAGTSTATKKFYRVTAIR